MGFKKVAAGRRLRPGSKSNLSGRGEGKWFTEGGGVSVENDEEETAGVA